jgi:Bacterial SH3 domain
MDANHGGKQGLRMSGLVLLALVLGITLTVGGFGSTAAQGTPTPGGPVACADILTTVEQNLAAACTSLAPDQACYANQSLQVEYADNATTISPFGKVGDIMSLRDLKSITTSPLKLQTGDWGFAVLKVQTSSVDASSGPGVTFFLYGDTLLTDLFRTSAEPPPPVVCTGTTTRVTNLRGTPKSSGQALQLLQPNTTVKVTGRSADDAWVQVEYQDNIGWLNAQTVKLSCSLSSLPQVGVTVPATMPALSGFYFSTGSGPRAACKDVPSGGLLIRSPKGLTVSFRANGADITIGSAVVLYAQPDESMSVVVLDGQATVSAQNFRRTVKTGQIVSLPLGGPHGRDVVGPPGAVYRVQQGLTFAASLCRFAQAIGLADVPCKPEASVKPLSGEG